MEYRGPQPADRRVAGRAESARQQPAEEPQPVREEPRSYRAEPPASRPEKRSRKPFILFPILGVVVLLIIAAFAWFALFGSHNKATGIDGSKYQAVFFTNGQVYFGKLSAFSDDYMKLTDIYYLQTQNNDQNSNNPQSTSGSEANSSVQLVKLGQEVHGPEDQMILSKDQVLFYENLKPDGKVAQSIQSYKNSHK